MTELYNAGSPGSLASIGTGTLEERRMARFRRMNSQAQVQADKITSGISAHFGAAALTSSRPHKTMMPRSTASAKSMQSLPQHNRASVNSLVPKNRFGKPLAHPAEPAIKMHTLVSRKAGSAMKDYTDMKFRNLHQAFRQVDADGSQKLDSSELLKASLAWNLKLSPEELDELLLTCDENGDGMVDYGEFSRGLGRLMTDRDAFGQNDSKVTSGHAVLGNQVIINDNLFAVPDRMLHDDRPAVQHKHFGSTDQAASEMELKRYIHQLATKVDEKYSKMQKAFRMIDEDKSGTLSEEEMLDAVMHFALPIPINHVQQMFAELADKNGDGCIDYNEFCQLLKGYDVI
mmetsp:Transcript_29283/g.75464  ORF Transcript_29283/g.75464 Transcript_29283/m.75464 type:complete len:345 (+) Transcript_29283:83-1117(+)|eukprot:CAMPEP_0115846150 /NCGR_PEP_ID=MMETSP0287-20121206/9715_1 /TAXON_ID=412157 /ORGANISM="Chrysochromulina rotalis, Strain UIO044" /LENGTH=344 /DNA_ID=CAMNT_0003299937 /DNA_START=81 /DNA_END=1115 /DNA_ORIENTATION=+